MPSARGACCGYGVGDEKQIFAEIKKTDLEDSDDASHIGFVYSLV